MDVVDAKSSSASNGKAAAEPHTMTDDMLAAEPCGKELFNQQVDMQRLEFLTTRMQLLQTESAGLRARHESREQETHDFVAYFQKEIQTRDKQISKLTEELASVKLSHVLEIDATVAAKEAVYQQMHQTYATKEESFTEQLFFLKDELQQLEMFRDMKETVQSKIQGLEAALQTANTEHHDGVRDLERKFLEEKARLQKEHEKRIEIVKQQAKEDARNGLDADTRKIVTDNRRMGEELRFQLQVTDELQRERQELETRARKYYTEVQIAVAKETEYANQAQRQAREIKQLRASVQALEKTMSESLAAVERDKHAEVARGGREREELALDADGLRRLLKLKNKELRNLRRLAQTILDQRTDVEQFFLDALEHVKCELVRERKRQHDAELERYHVEMKRAQGLRAGLRFPKLASPGDRATVGGANNALANAAGPPAPRHFSDKVDLRQLTWAERERVLRLVFAKINGAQSYAPDMEQQTQQESASHASPPPSRGLVDDSASVDECDSDDTSAGVYFATEPASPTLHRGITSGYGASSRNADVPNASVSMSLSGLPIVPSAPPPSHRHKHQHLAPRSGGGDRTSSS